MNLTMPLENNDLFDRQVRQALEQIKPSFDGDLWDRLDASLDAELPLSKDEAFDDLVRERLDMTETPAVTSAAAAVSAWDRMHASLDEAMPEPDAAVKEALSKLKPTYRADQWSRLERSLEKQEQKSVLVRFNWALRLSVAAAVLFTVGNVLWLEPWAKPFHVDLLAVQGVGQAADKSPASLSAGSKSKAVIKASDKALTTESTTEAFATDHVTTVQSTENLVQTIQKNLQIDVANSLIENPLPTLDVPIVGRPEALGLVASINDMILPPMKVAASEPLVFEGSVPMFVKKPVYKSNSAWRLSAQVSPNLDLAVTPFGESKRTVASNVYIGGVSAGLLAERMLPNQWSIETGLMYDNKNYRTQISKTIGNETQGFFQLNFEDVIFRMARIPITVRKFVFNGRRTRLYAQASANVNAVLQTNYSYDLEELGLEKPTNPNGEFAPITGAKELKHNFTDGVLEGGTTRENVYLSVGAGIGAEVTLGKKTKVFIQPQYNRYINPTGMEAYKDRFHTLSVSAGLRRKL
jgi:hypothetical protein